MNTTIRTTMLVIAIVMTSATIALAETIYFLKIEKNGIHVRTVPVSTDGSCTIGELAAGTYTVTIVDAQGKNLDLTGTIDIVPSPPANARGAQTRLRTPQTLQLRGTTPISFVVAPGDGVMKGAINTSKSNVKNTKLAPTAPN